MRQRRFVLFFIVLFFARGLYGQPPIGHWTFEPEMEQVDIAGNFDTLKMNGGRIENGFLYLDSSDYVVASYYTGADLTKDKTLVVWVILDDLKSPGGFPMAILAQGAIFFDGIGYGDAGPEPTSWFVGSNNWSRSNELSPGYAETEIGQLVQIALVHKRINPTQLLVKVYRNATLIGEYITKPSEPYRTGSAEVHFSRNTQTWIHCHIDEARLYDRALTQEEIKSLKPIHIPSSSFSWLSAIIAILAGLSVYGLFFLKNRIKK